MSWPESIFGLSHNSTETVSVAIQPTSESATFSDMVSEAKRVQPETTEADISAPPAQTGSATINSASNHELPTGSISDGFDTFNVLRAKGVLVLPDMHLDIHVLRRNTRGPIHFCEHV